MTKDFDDQGRLIVESTPEGVLGYSYDPLGRLTETAVYLAGDDPFVDAPQRTTSYTYDALSRLETVTEDRDASVTTDPLLTTTYQYDLVGNLDMTPGATTGLSSSQVGPALPDANGDGSLTLTSISVKLKRRSPAKPDLPG